MAAGLGLGKCTYLLRNGLIADGTGTEAFRGDVYIRGERIAAVRSALDAPRGETAEVVLDVSGKVIAPGFVDTHTHDDGFLLRSPDMLPKISQGATTVVVGNCGMSLAPFTKGTDPLPPLTLLGEKGEFRYDTFSDFVRAVEGARPNTNVAALVGHTTLRLNQMDDVYRPASQEEILRMQEQLVEGLESGAVGFSTGLAYPEAFKAEREEVDALLKNVKKYGGVYATHQRDQSDGVIESTQESLDTVRKAGVPLIVSHFACVDPPNWGKMADMLAMVDKAAESGTVVVDRYPYTAGSTLLYSHQALVEGVKVMISWSEPHPDRQGQYLHDIARDWGCSLSEACDRLQPANAIYFSTCEEDVQRVLKHPLAMIGSDGLPLDKHPHPRLWGTFPRVLGHYTRELKLFSVVDIVRRMTSLPAKVFGLHERGSLREGYFADVVVFDPETIQDRATYQQPIQTCVGIDLVMVNGCIAYRDGHLTGNRAGRFLKRKSQPE